MNIVETKKIYRHFKGKYIYVEEIAYDSETLENMVIYRHLGDSKLWVRSEKMFLENIDEFKNNNITNQTTRFMLVNKINNDRGE